MSLSIPGLEGAELIGRGAFGDVYRAQQSALGRVVAVKVFNTRAGSDVELRLFDKECRAIGQLDWCPSIVTVFDVGITGDGKRYLMMELAPGGSLADVLREQGPLDETAARRVAHSIGEALVAAHGAGVLHRDIKPANILVSRSGEPLLADFGIARLSSDQPTATGVLSGTVAYASPEVLGGAHASPSSDIYSLGATVYALLSGRSPHATSGSDSLASLVARAVNGPPADVPALGVSPDFARILQRCLARDPAQRYPTANELVADLAVGTSAVTATLRPAEPTLVSARPHTGERSWPAEFSSGRPPTAPLPGGPWPTPTDYVTAVQNRVPPIGDPAWAQAAVARDLLGMPASASGRNAIVFELEHPAGPMALRCLTRADPDAPRRYHALGQFLAQQPLPFVAPATWVDQAVLVQERWWPAVVMPWAPGAPLDLVVEDMLDQPDQLHRLAAAWQAVCRSLVSVGAAHGDLQCGNVIVDGDGRLVLVDLDGFYVPGGPPTSSELGHPHFQHPARDASHFGAQMDAFSMLVIYTSLQALAADNTLWTHHNSENLILSATDFATPTASPVFAQMLASPDPSVREATSRLMEWCRLPVPPTLADVSPLLGLPIASATDTSSASAPAHATQLASSPAIPASQQQTQLGVPSHTEAPNRLPQVEAGQAPWWSGGAAPTTSPPPDPPPSSRQGRGIGTLLTGNTVVAGAVAGIVCALFVLVLDLVALRHLPNAAHAPTFLILIGGVLAGVLASLSAAAMRQWGRAALRLVAGLAVGSALSAGALALAQFVLLKDMNAQSDALELPVLTSLWIMCAVAVGAAAGLVRRRARAVASGLVGGALGGILGGLLHSISSPELLPRKGSGYFVIELDSGNPLTIVAITLACAAAGTAIGLVDRLRRVTWLTVIEGPMRGRELSLEHTSTLLGTSPAAGLRLIGETAAIPEHLRIDHTDGGYLASANGPTVLNGHRMTPGQPTPLASRDVIAVGGTFIRFETRETR